MMTGILTLAILTFATTLAIEVLRKRASGKYDDLIERIDQTLPQTQCAQCGYPGCRPYAEAIAHNKAPIDLCPPGGNATLTALQNLLDQPMSSISEQPPLIARIDEDECIGCALCLPACPVDAIVGAPQWMHTVIEEQCTGCELCVAPCPVDCISMESQAPLDEYSLPTHPIPCIQCDACNLICPENLDVKSLYQLVSHTKIEQAVSSRLNECTECGICDSVCPSEIPLTAFFHSTHLQYEHLHTLEAQADVSKKRYEIHTLRMATQSEKWNASQKRKAMLKQKISQKNLP